MDQQENSDNPSKKKSAFKPLRSLVKFFQNTRSNSKTQSEFVTSQREVLHARSSEDVLVTPTLCIPQATEIGNSASSKQLSISADSVFLVERFGSMRNHVDHPASQLLNNNAGGESSSDERLVNCPSVLDYDDGLPRSPSNINTVADVLAEIKQKHFNKWPSFDSGHSFISEESSDDNLDEEFFKDRWSQIPKGADEIGEKKILYDGTELDLNLLAQNHRNLVSSAATHRINIKPKGRRVLTVYQQRINDFPDMHSNVLTEVKEEAVKEVIALYESVKTADAKDVKMLAKDVNKDDNKVAKDVNKDDNKVAKDVRMLDKDVNKDDNKVAKDVKTLAKDVNKDDNKVAKDVRRLDKDVNKDDNKVSKDVKMLAKDVNKDDNKDVRMLTKDNADATNSASVSKEVKTLEKAASADKEDKRDVKSDVIAVRVAVKDGCINNEDAAKVFGKDDNINKQVDAKDVVGKEVESKKMKADAMLDVKSKENDVKAGVILNTQTDEQIADIDGDLNASVGQIEETSFKSNHGEDTQQLKTAELKSMVDRAQESKSETGMKDDDWDIKRKKRVQSSDSKKKKVPTATLR